MSRTRVLFLCTHNSARGQMAEGFLRTYGDDRYEAFSAGLEPRQIDPLTVRVIGRARHRHHRPALQGSGRVSGS